MKQHFWWKYFLRGYHPCVKITEIPGGGVWQTPTGMEIMGGAGFKKVPCVEGGAMDIFWNYILQKFS